MTIKILAITLGLMGLSMMANADDMVTSNINHYKMVCGEKDVAEAEINRLIRAGWWLYGNPFLSFNHKYVFCQAMVKL